MPWTKRETRKKASGERRRGQKRGKETGEPEKRERRGGRWRSQSLRKGVEDGDSAGRRLRRAGPGAGPRSPGADPAGGAWPRCGRRSSHIPPGFPHIRHQSVPKAPAFPAPLPRHWLEKLFFTPSWSLICCGKRKRLLLNEGLRGGRGGGTGDCVSRSCAPTLGWGLPGCRPSWGRPGRWARAVETAWSRGARQAGPAHEGGLEL